MQCSIGLALVFLFSLPADSLPSVADPPRILLQRRTDERGQDVIAVENLPEGMLEQIRAKYKTEDDLRAIFPIKVRTNTADDATPNVSGTYQLHQHRLLFHCRYPLLEGVVYRAVFKQSQFDREPSVDLVREIAIPRKNEAPSTTITHVYPTSDVLPENLLKFYIHFSAPMSRGEVYRRVKLLREDGSAVDLPFLELAEELWDVSGTRITLLFDPGRIKRGLKPREDSGPALEAGKRYRFVIEAGWPDETGLPLVKGFCKEFLATPPDVAQPNPSNWKLIPPSAGSTEPLILVSPEPLEHALLERVVSVHDPTGAKLAGTVSIADRETRWEFVPDRPWPAGTSSNETEYTVRIKGILEDLAGNSVDRPFEVDLIDTIGRPPRVEFVERKFRLSPERR